MWLLNISGHMDQNDNHTSIKFHHFIAMCQYKKGANPVHLQCSFVFFALTHQYMNVITEVSYEHHGVSKTDNSTVSPIVC